MLAVAPLPLEAFLCDVDDAGRVRPLSIICAEFWRAREGCGRTAGAGLLLSVSFPNTPEMGEGAGAGELAADIFVASLSGTSLVGNL